MRLLLTILIVIAALFLLAFYLLIKLVFMCGAAKGVGMGAQIAFTQSFIPKPDAIEQDQGHGLD